MVLPVVLLILFATLEFGMVFGRYQVISGAAREGVRVASLYRGPGCTASTVRSEVRQSVRSNTNSLGIFPGDVRVKTEGLCQPGDTRVVATYRHRWIVLPGVSRLPFINLVGVAVMRNEI